MPVARAAVRRSTLFPSSLLLALLLCCWESGLLPAAEPAAAPVPLAEATQRMTPNKGFQVTLFAGEPDVVQPIALATDDRGRLWVVECLSYPKWVTPAPGAQGTDRVVILADTDGDGRHDQRTVFAENLFNLSAIQYGHGGVWLCSTPKVVFIPDRNRDDRPDGPPEVLLDGFSLQAKHNVSAALQWGPDGWLYGCNGILSNSRIGPPGTPDDQRIAMNCGVWKVHPVTRQFEVVASGTTNPWGLDFDDYGQMFITNCVIAHLWHVIPGAHYQRMFGQDLNPYSYELLATCADHIHWGGGAWQESRTGAGAHDQAGGGHAHSGAMVYLGDNFPPEYRNSVYTCNIHGNRVNRDALERRDSGYLARHAPDFLRVDDSWFRGVALTAGADGAVYVADWSDTGECHDYEDIHRENGRIYKVTFGQPRFKPLDLATATDAQLIDFQSHANDWYGRHARLLLQARAAAKSLQAETSSVIKDKLLAETDERKQLRWLWTHFAVAGPLDEALAGQLLKSPHAAVRGWVIRLLADTQRPELSPSLLQQLVSLARDDKSPAVRLELASAAQMLLRGRRSFVAQKEVRGAVILDPTPGTISQCQLILEQLAGKAADADDPNLPLMIWYATARLIERDAAAGLRIAASAKISKVREFIARRLGPTEAVIGLLKDLKSPADQADVLQGLLASVEGLRELKLPAAWSAVSTTLLTNTERSVREPALVLSVLAGDQQALEQLRSTIQDKRANPQSRQVAVSTLALLKQADSLPLLIALLSDEAVRGEALRGLAAFDDAKIAPAIIAQYAQLAPAEKLDALAVLASRHAAAMQLLAALDQGKIARTEIPLSVIRQILRIPGAGIREAVEKSWGQIRDTAAERRQLVSRYKGDLTPERQQAARLDQGKLLFQKNCANCHVLFGEGQKIGPELTGAQRKNLDYVLENLLDPSAVVATDYQVTVIATKDGRTLSGVVVRESPAAVVLQSATGQTVVPTAEIEERVRQNLSLMPEGLLEKLTADEVRDLLGYLMSN